MEIDRVLKGCSGLRCLDNLDHPPSTITSNTSLNPAAIYDDILLPLFSFSARFLPFSTCLIYPSVQY